VADETHAFPKDVRLRTPEEFKRVYNLGAKRSSRFFVLFELQNGKEYSRFGLTTPRKLGKAHDRNRIKRSVREILRTSRSAIPKGFDFVVNPKQAVVLRRFNELREDLIALFGDKE
jgi:ribonuclease P protein component